MIQRDFFYEWPNNCIVHKKLKILLHPFIVTIYLRTDCLFFIFNFLVSSTNQLVQLFFKTSSSSLHKVEHQTSSVKVNCWQYESNNLTKMTYSLWHLKQYHARKTQQHLRIQIGCTLGSWREFGCRDDAKAWRKSTKEADKHNFFIAI